MIKRLVCALLALLLVTGLTAGAEAADDWLEEYVPSVREISLGVIASDEETHINVGSMTHVNGAFFTSQFGNNTSDIDVRTLLHGYNPIVWTSQLQYAPDAMVVENLASETDESGNRTYTFTIAEDLYWNDGTQITAKDYVFSFLLQASKEFAEIGADTDIWSHIMGSEEYETGKNDCLAGVRLIDEYTCSVTVKGEYLPFFYELSMLMITPSPIDVIAPGCRVEDTVNGSRIVNEDDNVTEPIFTADLLARTVLDPEHGYLSHPVKTCGPYSLTGYDAKTGIVDFAKNEYYKGDYEGFRPVITTVTLYPVKDGDIAELMLEGKIDLVNKVVDGDTIQTLLALPMEGFENERYARIGYGFVTFACEKGAQSSNAVRKAIACCFDSDAFIAEYLKGFGIPVYGYYGLGQWMMQAFNGNIRPADMTEEQAAIWEGFTLDSLDRYDYDTDRAVMLLEGDGWTLNSKGGNFNPKKDSVRYKSIDDELIPLSFTFGLTAGNKAAQMIADSFKEAFKTVGAELIVVEAPFTEVLSDYFADDDERKYDMSFLASNFVSRFDTLADFYFDEDGAGSQNHSEIQDAELLKVAWDLHNTESNDLFGYMENWVSFQQRFNEVLPTLPIYSNVYIDFFTSRLKGYQFKDSEEGWPGALMHSFITGESEEWIETETEENDGLDIFID